MNKKFILIIFAIFAFMLCINGVNAATTTTINCNSFGNKNQCETFAKCKWISGSCQAQNVASEPCNDNNIRKVLKIFGFILLIAKLVIPLLIIGIGTFDLYKAVIDKDEKSLGKQVKILLIRIITGLFVFFIPNMVHAIFSLSGQLDIINTDEYETCATCILEPTNDTVCSVN